MKQLTLPSSIVVEYMDLKPRISTLRILVIPIQITDFW